MKLNQWLVPAAVLLWLGTLAGCTVRREPLPPPAVEQAEYNFPDFDAYESQAQTESYTTDAPQVSGEATIGIYIGFGGSAPTPPEAPPAVRRPVAGTPFETPKPGIPGPSVSRNAGTPFDAPNPGIPGPSVNGNAGVPSQPGKISGRMPPQLKSDPARASSRPGPGSGMGAPRSVRGRQEYGNLQGRMSDRSSAAGRTAPGTRSGFKNTRPGSGNKASGSPVPRSGGRSAGKAQAGRAASGSAPQIRQAH